MQPLNTTHPDYSTDGEILLLVPPPPKCLYLGPLADDLFPNNGLRVRHKLVAASIIRLRVIYPQLRLLAPNSETDARVCCDAAGWEEVQDAASAYWDSVYGCDKNADGVGRPRPRPRPARRANTRPNRT